MEEPVIQRTAVSSTSSGSDAEELKEPAEIHKSRPLVLASQKSSREGLNSIQNKLLQLWLEKCSTFHLDNARCLNLKPF